MIYIKICYFISLSLVMLKGLYYLFTLLQQSHYHIKEYTKSFYTYYFKKVYNYILYILIAISFTNNIYLYIFGQVLVIISVLINDRFIIKLKITKRILRLIFTYFILQAIVTFLFKNLNITSLLYILNPFIVIIANFINLPLEHLIKKRYIHQASKKLSSLENVLKVAITGSFGKTSTKNIIYSLFENKYITVKTPQSFNTIMGLTKVINNSINTTTEVFVCEMGASKKNEIRKMEALIKPQIRIITDVGLQHISTFKTLENVLEAKFELLNKENKESINILNGDNELIKTNSKDIPNTIYFGINKENTFNARNIVIDTNKTSFDIYHFDKYILTINTKLLGIHNVKNILATFALTNALTKYNITITNEEFVNVISKLEPTPHRLTYKKVGNVHLYDDSYNANIVGFQNSVEVLSKVNLKKVIITPGIVDAGASSKELNESLVTIIDNVFDDIYIINNPSGIYIYNKLKDVRTIYLVKSFKEAYEHALKNNKEEEFALLLANDLPDNYLVRRIKNDK